MANYQTRADQLVDGEYALVRGRLVFSRLTSLIDGKALEASIAAARKRGSKYPTDKPHTRVALSHAQVLVQDQNNPNNTELFINERFYDSPSNPASGKNYSHDNKGTILPVIAIPNGQGQVVQDTSGRDLAADSDVTLVLRAYQAGDQANLGLSLDTVVVNDPEVKYYSGTSNVGVDALSKAGITFAAPPQAVNAADQQSTGETQPIESDATGTIVDEDGFAMPGPGVAPQAAAPAPVAAPAAQAAPQVQPAAPVQPAPVQAQPAQVQQPAQPSAEASAAEENARLKAQIEAMQNAGSPVGAAAGAPAVGNPWTAGQAGITPQV